MIGPWRWAAVMALTACQVAPSTSTEPTAASPTQLDEVADPQHGAASEQSAETRDADAPPSTPPSHAITTASGLVYELLAPGDTEQRAAGSAGRVEMRYRVWNSAGHRIAASTEGKTETMAVNWLPVGWAEGMTLLPPGAHARLWIPAKLGYENEPAGPQGALLVDVEVVSVEHVEQAAIDTVPLMAPPANALRTKTGLAFVILEEGTGVVHPKRDAKVTVHYEGWTTDGNQFDSSYARGKPATFPLNAVIPGWQEAVPLMVEGEKSRFWIPAELAYGTSPGKPQGMLIFDIELIRIEP